MIVTIDGPAGAGKSSTARALAGRLGFRFLDTGAMYRAVALAAIRRELPWDQALALADLAGRLDILVTDTAVWLDGDDVTREIRAAAITKATHHAANNPGVRARLVELQRQTVGDSHVVTEGRDQGTVVFPQAQCKIFLFASPEERARRRVQELTERGEEHAFEQVLADQHERDRGDASRAVGPLAKAADAIEFCTDNLSPDEVVDRLEAIVRARMEPCATVQASTVSERKPKQPVERSLAKRWWYAFMRVFLRLVGVSLFHLRWWGREHIPADGGVLILSNHQSHFDPPLIGLCIDRRINYLARETLFAFPPFRWLIYSLDAIPIDREGLGLSGLKETLKRLKRGELVLIFPEGTRSPDGEVHPLKPGFSALARRAGVPLLPVALDGPYQAWPRRQKFPTLGVIHVQFGPPLWPHELDQYDERQLVDEIERRIRECHEAARMHREQSRGDA